MSQARPNSKVSQMIFHFVEQRDSSRFAGKQYNAYNDRTHEMREQFATFRSHRRQHDAFKWKTWNV